jgi:uroporphyrinogen-III decarboxylase
MNEANKKLYEERLNRVNAALSLKEPDRVPIAPMYMTFPYLYAGYTMKDVNYDAEKAKDAIRKYLLHFEPDMAYGYDSMFCGQGQMLEQTGIKWLQWAGQKDAIVHDRSIFQYMEKDYMEDDDYEEFFSDRTGWIMRKYLPRTFKIFEGFEYVDFRSMVSYGFMSGTMQFANPAIAECFKILGELAGQYIKYYTEAAAFNKEIEELGFVQEMQATTTTAFDNLSDCLRGTLGTMTDLMEQPENVLRAVELFYPGTLYGALAQAKNSNGRVVFIPLHKGMDTFLSGDQYKKFYWDTLLRMVNGLIDAGLTPLIYTEGPYNSRVECLMDTPKGKCWIHFEEADMRRVKKLLGNIACLSGGIKSTMLMSGTKEDVIAKTKENIDILAPGGGYIFDLSDTMEDCKPELVEAMFETVKTYGVYK